MLSQIISKLTITRMWKNRHVYIPYIASVIGTMALFFSLNNLLSYEILETSMGGDILKIMLYLGIGIIIIFASIFLLYTASFLMKTQQKELALYGILGMERGHLVFIVFLENIIIYLIGLVFGALIGWLLSYVLFLGFARMFEMTVIGNAIFSIQALLTMSAVFGVVFVGIMLINVKSIYQIQLSSMLNESVAGEKKIRFMTVKGLIGLACIGYGYYLSFTTLSALDSIYIFFVAVFFVIIGTYLFFGSSITMILNWMKKNKSVYYNKKNFIVISNMLSRMRKNAAGLATITILSTMLLVALSTTIAWFDSIDTLTAESELYDISLSTYTDNENAINTLNSSIERLDEAAKKNNVTLQSKNIYQIQLASIPIIENEFQKNTDGLAYMLPRFVTLEQFNEIAGTNLTLEKDEIYVWGENSEFTDYDNPLKIDDHMYKIKPGLTKEIQNQYRKTPKIGTKATAIEIIVASEEQLSEINELFHSGYGVDSGNTHYEYYTDILGEEKDRKIFIDFVNEHQEEIFQQEDNITMNIALKGDMRRTLISIFGMILFVGVLLSALFLLATALVIYYKQLTEGIEDGKQYQIMQKIGMSQKEMKQVGNKQILIFFFVPLLVATCHTFAAIPILTILSSGIFSVPVEIMLKVNAIVALCFVVVYILIYLMTSKAYYKSIKRTM